MFVFMWTILSLYQRFVWCFVAVKAATFKKTSHRVHRKMWWRSTRWTIILVLVALFIIGIVILIILFSTHVLPVSNDSAATTTTTKAPGQHWNCVSRRVVSESRTFHPSHDHPRPSGFFQWFVTVGGVIWLVKTVPEMIYSMWSGTLSLFSVTLTIPPRWSPDDIFLLAAPWKMVLSITASKYKISNLNN